MLDRLVSVVGHQRRPTLHTVSQPFSTFLLQHDEIITFHHEAENESKGSTR